MLYCRHASQYNETVEGKPWRYLLVPHDQVKANMSLGFLVEMFEKKAEATAVV